LDIWLVKSSYSRIVYLLLEFGLLDRPAAWKVYWSKGWIFGW
jgi:hypothetical protein